MSDYKVNGDLASFEECNIFSKEALNLIALKDEIEIDFKLVHRISSTGVGRIYTIEEKLKEAGKKLKIINMRKEVKNVLKIMGVLAFVKFIDFE
jgi:anti-anti-sigma regulatory factor